MRYHCRCRACRTRRVLPKHPEHYDRLPQCRVCGKRNYHVDKWMNRRNVKAMTCTCNGSGAYHYPHRRGSPFCWYRADGTDRYPGDPDFKHPQMELAA